MYNTVNSTQLIKLTKLTKLSMERGAERRGDFWPGSTSCPTSMEEREEEA